MRVDFWFRRLRLLRSLAKKKVPHGTVATSVRVQENVRIYIGKKCSGFEIGEKVQVRRNSTIEAGGKLLIGPETVVGVGNFIQADGEVEIGQGCLFGPSVKVFSTSHDYGREGELHQPLSKGAVRIGKNVWVGAGCVISSNVVVGDNSVIGANSFVNKDVPPNCVVAGSPAKVIKEF